ncbi:MAG: HAD-IA family hydrolase [bacterium]
MFDPADIKAVAFDLDHTLWDHDAALTYAVTCLCDCYGLEPDAVLPVYRRHNLATWAKLEDGLITMDEARTERFALTLAELGIDGLDAGNLFQEYRDYYLEKPFVVAGAREIVEWCAKRWPVYIFSNGANDTQHPKLSLLGLDGHIRELITSEDAGAMKPSKVFYDYALSRVGLPPEQILLVGDSWKTDVAGGKSAGLRVVWFNPGAVSPPKEAGCTPDFELRELNDLSARL